MRVIIPAAGRGTRLQPMTDAVPKCMIDIHGRPLLSYMLMTLKHLPVEEVIIVTGYKRELIEDYVEQISGLPAVRCIFNERFDTTNSIVSLSLTREFWDEPFCVIDSDLLVRPKLIEELVSNDGTCLVVDDSKPYEKIDMKVKVVDDRFVYMDKTLPPVDSNGEFFGLAKWMPGAAAEFGRRIEECIAAQQTNLWYEYAIREIAGRTVIPTMSCTSEDWCEIDNAADYEYALGFAGKWKEEWGVYP